MPSNAWDPDTAAPEVRDTLSQLLETAVMLSRADMGKLHLLDGNSDVLTIVAHRGFSDAHIRYFVGVDGDPESICRRALNRKARVVVDDVTKDPFYAQHVEVTRAVGFSAVQCTPLIGKDGALVGALVTHYKKPHQLSSEEVQALDQLASHVADQICRLMQ
jgi:GAF domain-containing protein